uniref:Probable heat shock factor protein homolog n=1 Tax=Zeugodacus cucurbitae TaxID=28588 RepID=A0A0A1XET9_ZEUCU
MLTERDKKLCALVQLYPQLYNKSHKYYGNAQARKDTWQELNKKMWKLEIDYKDRWEKLLTTYGHCDPGKQLYLPEPMEFLRPYLCRKSAVKNYRSMSTHVKIYQESHYSNCAVYFTHKDDEVTPYRMSNEVMMRFGNGARELGAIAKRNPYQY